MTSAENDAAQARAQEARIARMSRDPLAKLRAEMREHPNYGKADPEAEKLERATVALKGDE